MATDRHHEGLGPARLLMVLSSISPLFIVWAIRGNSPLPDFWFATFCAFMVITPNGFLFLRIRTAKQLEERRDIVVGRAEDHREHLLVYLFAMLLPFYAAGLSNWRDFAASIAALTFIVFLFWHLNLHYMNVIFAVLGYRVFTVYPPEDTNRITDRTGQVVITRRAAMSNGDRLTAYRLSDTVYFEVTS